MRQMVSAPLVAQEKVRGVINLASAQADAYSTQDLEMLEQIAPQLTVAIEKAQLFDLMERRTAELQTLNRMGERLVSTTDTSRILSIALAFVPHLVPGDVHALLLVDEEDGHLGLNIPFAVDQSFADKIIQEMLNALTPLIELEELDLVHRKIITGQKPIVTRAKKSISNFKLRAGMPIGCSVTLRRQRMYEFLDRLINIALPRVRDFRGISGKAFDGRGNYTMGIREQIIFPEINYDKIDKIRGMNITIVTTARTDEEAKAFLKYMGMPFRN